jgi:ABC-2 type transport system ATP-binding protein
MSDELIEFWSQAAPDYDRVVELQIGPGTRARVRERVAREGALGRVVEFGCGTGFFTEALASKASSLLATDASPGMVAFARERLRASWSVGVVSDREVALVTPQRTSVESEFGVGDASHVVGFQVADCQGSPLPADAFDTALLGLVLQFVDHERTIAEMRRVLKPGGLLLIANLDVLALSLSQRMQCLFRVVYQGRRGYAIRPPRRFGRNVIGRGRLCQMLAEHGFEVLGHETITNATRASYIPVNYVRARRTSGED